MSSWVFMRACSVSPESWRQEIVQRWSVFAPISYLRSNATKRDSDLDDACTELLRSIFMDQVVAEKSGIRDAEAFFLTNCMKQTLFHFEEIRKSLSQIDSVSEVPTWWGDFVFYTFFQEGEHFLEVIASHMNLKNVDCSLYGRSNSLLELVAMAWSLELYESSEAPLPAKILKTPLKPQFNFDPQSFMATVYYMNSLPPQHSVSRLVREKGIWTSLPIMFSCAQGRQNFDKKQLFLTIKEILASSSPFGAGRRLHFSALNLGLYITWSPQIHNFASLKDQKKIELFYLASKLDSGSILASLPIEIIRIILEGNYYLGKRHTPCSACKTMEPGFHGMQFDWKDCCRLSCGCCEYHDLENRNHEICLGKDPIVDLWGYANGMWNFINEDLESYSVRLQRAPKPKMGLSPYIV